MSLLPYLLLLLSVAGKSVNPLVTLIPTSRWVYISKFIQLDGRGLWNLKAKVHRPVNETSTDRAFLHINVYPEDVWEEALVATECTAKTAVSREKRIKVPLNGNYSTPISGTLNQNRKVTVWYIAISDCENSLPPDVKLRVELWFRSRTMSEFSYEEEGLVYFYPVGALVFLIGTLVTSLEIYRKSRKTEYTDWRQVSIAVALGLQTLGLLLQSLHLFIYAYNGSGVILFDFFSQAFEAFSHLLVTIVLILISTGWTLKYREFAEVDTYAPVFLLLVILQLALVCAAKITDDAYYKFSEYESTPGWILIAVRVGLWVWFLYNVKKQYASAQGKMRDFLLSFALFSSLYFLSIPASVLLSQLFPLHQRTTLLALGNIVVQAVSFWLLHELFSDRSTYFKLSTASEGVLPGKVRSD